MMMMPVTAVHCLRQVLNIGEGVVLRCVVEIRCELVQLGCLGCVAIGGGCFGGVLQVGGDLRRYLLVLGGIRLLQLLQSAQHLGEGGKLRVAVLRQQKRRGVRAITGLAVRRTAGLQAAEERLNVSAGEIGNASQIHAAPPGNPQAAAKLLKTLFLYFRKRQIHGGRARVLAAYFEQQIWREIKVAGVIA